ncbi:hypothetical protein ED733_000403 [Metarhizium rileyi]|uniref:Uncharacterized protein n=1 Tax=Metarhizium rileyi (strain RCEF 4871) TaxID=1649241 RepID=A0A5C6FY85_METRR|nr:hypothetical protein ED733_000403 [Metarhizium rileyi]
MITPNYEELALTHLFGLKIISTRAESQESSVLGSEAPSSARSSPSHGRRRSVSRMKDLIPLRLSPSSSSAWSASQSAPSDQGMVERVDGYLPEVLARDLELSADMFAEKEMTAGAPLVAPGEEERARFRNSRAALYSPYLADSARLQSLGSIEERKSILFQVQELPMEKHDHLSESSSTSSHYRSDDAEPPDFRHRGSVVTNATSLASVTLKKKNLPSFDDQYESSWMVVDSDGEDHDDGNSEEFHAGSQSLRPQTPPHFEAGSSMVEGGPNVCLPSPSSQTHNTFPRKPHSISDGSLADSGRRHLSGKPQGLPVRPSTMKGPRTQSAGDSFANGEFRPVDLTRCQSLKALQRAQSLRVGTTRDSPLPTPPSTKLPLPPSTIPELSPVGNPCSELDEKMSFPVARHCLDKRRFGLVRPPTPVEPLNNVQSWLNSSLQPYPSASATAEAARALPLPPDAIETLRVSVVCFPETMLLTSSLTVETIRSYAKKMRHPLADFSDSPGDIFTQSARKSLWRRVVRYKKGPQLPGSKLTPGCSNSNQDSGLVSSSSAELDAPKPWIPVKNVFGQCSDYICDALYAHIVSYNYVSALVARNPVPLAGNGRSNSLTARSQQQDDIPKKAASLLGLAPTAEAAASLIRLPRRVNSPLDEWNQDGIMTSHSTTPSSQDNALRVIQSGLLQCISRLAATAKLMAETGTGEGCAVDVEAEGAEVMFIRSLCEIVRMAEEVS